MKKTFIFFVFLLATKVFAQPGDPGGGEDPDNPVPFHGIGWLLAAGGAYGVKKMLDKKSRKVDNS